MESTKQYCARQCFNDKEMELEVIISVDFELLVCRDNSGRGLLESWVRVVQFRVRESGKTEESVSVSAQLKKLTAGIAT